MAKPKQKKKMPNGPGVGMPMIGATSINRTPSTS